VDHEDVAELVGEPDRTSDWAAVEPIRGDLGDPAFWADRWTPWQRTESARSWHELGVIRAVASGRRRACEAIAGCYRPDEETRRLFGPAAEWVEPHWPCGRCPGCRREGVRPPDDPPPGPPQQWPAPAEQAARLDDLAAAAGARDGLILLVADEQEQVTGPLARALVRRGVRHLAGPLGAPPRHDGWLFVDPDPVRPEELTPASSFVVYPPTSRIPSTWLSARRRQTARSRGPRAFDVLLLAPGARLDGRLVERDLPTLNATTALDLLEG